MVHSWYLPCDFHYFILGIFLVMLIKRNARLGLALLTALFLASIAIPFLITVAYSRPALLHFFPEFLIAPRSHPDFHYTYIKSHTRASTYFVGMYAGYVYYKLKGRDYQLSKVRVFFPLQKGGKFLFLNMPCTLFLIPVSLALCAPGVASVALRRHVQWRRLLRPLPPLRKIRGCSLCFLASASLGLRDHRPPLRGQLRAGSAAAGRPLVVALDSAQQARLRGVLDPHELRHPAGGQHPEPQVLQLLRHRELKFVAK